MPLYENEARGIENLQRYLRQLSYHEPSITPPPIDGIFERDTEQALRDFQALQRLPVTGIADLITWDLLYAAYRASLAEHTPPRAVSFFPIDEDFAAFRTDTDSFPVAVLQYMLRELGARYGDLEEITVNGRYDGATQAAVRTFQRHNGLSENGRIDLPTWNAITDQHNILLYGEG
ncbi:MAG: peptidoglycan-binding protein [Clostridia bacterium]|nr:peptidoglycan-binding protein [Clostridia bacterium]